MFIWCFLNLVLGGFQIISCFVEGVKGEEEECKKRKARDWE